ncbi:hypothetical protein ASC59_12405 [Leifsonia sp. Root1293]|nr:hypothetical protein ASC59_12405 [Leifsonia sp. Root1293]KRA08664.1 hypothetical protein ASD61_12405 [Leifsonia sp. Root60]
MISAAYDGAMPTRTPTALVALPATVAIAAALALALSGCAGGSPAPSDAASDSPNPTPTFGPSTSSPASSSPVAPRDQSAFGTESPIYAPGCETFLTEEQTVALVDQGYVPDPTSTWPDVMAEAAAAGGTWCAWTAPDGSPDIRGGVVAIPEALWQAKRGDLIAQGATEDDASRPGFIALPDEGAPDVDGGFVYADGYLVYVSDPKLAASVTVLQ